MLVIDNFDVIFKNLRNNYVQGNFSIAFYDRMSKTYSVMDFLT